MEIVSVRVLLVDDDPEDLTIVRKLLRRAEGLDIELVTAASYDEAVAELERSTFDLHLVDFVLGEKNGLDLVRWIRTKDRDVPVILLTNMDRPARDLEALREGASDYLPKHRLSTAELQRAIHHARERAAGVRRLRASEERYALAVQGANDGIWDWNLDTNEVHYSARWWALLGVEDPPENPGTIDAWTDRVHSADQEDLRRALTEHIEGLAPHVECEFRMRNEDGEYHWMLARGVGVRGKGGSIRRMAGSLSDVSERRYAQERLISHVSHELRTPLTAIYQFLSNLTDGLAGEISDPQTQLVEAALRNVGELDTMINGLVEATRARTDKFSLDRQRLRPQELIDEVCASHVSVAEKSGLTLTSRQDQVAPSCYGDATRLRQVLVNLVGNAIKFVPPGGTIEVAARVDAGDPDRVRFDVIDDGPGIPIVHQRRIFERLAQVEDAGTRSRKGLGLGLFISKEIVARHGGRIWVESRVGAGSTFSFTVPLFDLGALVAPSVAESRRRRRGLALIDVELMPPPGAGSKRVDPVELRQLRSIAERSVVGSTDSVVPRRSAGPADGVMIVASTDVRGAEIILERFRRQIADTFDPDLNRVSWTVSEVEPSTLAACDERDAIARLVAELERDATEVVPA